MADEKPDNLRHTISHLIRAVKAVILLGPKIPCPKLANNPANTGLRYRTRMGNCPIVANPWMIKGIPRNKSDTLDSRWIADNCLDGKIKRSRVLPKDDRDLRTLTRARSAYTKTRTQLRNRIHVLV